MNNEKKTFIILTPGFPESEADSTCLPMQQQFVRTLKELHPGVNIIVLSFQYPYHKNPYRWFDIMVMPFCGRNKGGLSKLLLRRRVNASLKKIHRTTKITGLFSFWYNECAFVGKKFADKYGVRHCCWILGQDAKRENKYPRLLHLPADELIALSDFLQNEFEKNHGVRPQFVISPGIDPRLFDNSVKEKDIDILATGSLIPLKQYGVFLEAIAEIKKQIPAVKALLAGKGPEKEKLQSVIVKLELQENVVMTGELPHQEVLQLMQRTRVFLHPASYEGFSGVCLEALYAGAHVISFCNPMKNDIMHWHIVSNKEEMITKAMKILQDQQAEYKSVREYSMNDTAFAVMKLFENSVL